MPGIHFDNVAPDARRPQQGQAQPSSVAVPELHKMAPRHKPQPGDPLSEYHIDLVGEARVRVLIPLRDITATRAALKALITTCEQALVATDAAYRHDEWRDLLTVRSMLQQTNAVINKHARRR